MHGYLADKNSFVKNIPYFKKNFNVYALDLKGFGKNQGMEYPYSLDDYIKEVKDFIKENNIESPMVIAHSFGGRIALKMASEDKDAFSKMVLTGCAGLRPRFSIKKWIKKCVFRILKIFIKKEKLAKFYSKDYNSLSPIMKQSFNKIVNEHLDDRLKDIKVKTLIVFGSKDRETPLYMAKRLNQGIQNSKKLIIKGAGHFVFLDCPLKFNMEVEEFLLN